MSKFKEEDPHTPLGLSSSARQILSDSPTFSPQQFIFQTSSLFLNWCHAFPIDTNLRCKDKAHVISRK